MIGILFLIGIAFWFAVSLALSRKIPRWLGVTKNGAVISVLLFPVILAAPVADEIIGRWQFHRLCEREAVVTLSPDWEKVRKARVDYLGRTEIGNSMIPIYSEVSQPGRVRTAHADSFEPAHAMRDPLDGAQCAPLYLVSRGG